MIASLPMYWRDETAAGWRALWDLVRAALPGLPDLSPPDRLGDLHAHWLSPDLALSMTCGLPLRTALRGKVDYVGTLDFGLGNAPGYYHSQVIAREGFAPGTPPRLAFNASDSQSGWAAAQHLAPFAGLVETGSHAASLAAVAEGRADIACLDAVTWRLLQRFDPQAASVHPLQRTPATPGLPLITAKGRDPAPLRAALAQAVAALDPATAEAIGGLRGFVVLAPAEYFDIPVPPAPAPA